MTALTSTHRRPKGSHRNRLLLAALTLGAASVLTFTPLAHSPGAEAKAVEQVASTEMSRAAATPALGGYTKVKYITVSAKTQWVCNAIFEVKLRDWPAGYKSSAGASCTYSSAHGDWRTRITYRG